QLDSREIQAVRSSRIARGELPAVAVRGQGIEMGRGAAIVHRLEEVEIVQCQLVTRQSWCKTGWKDSGHRIRLVNDPGCQSKELGIIARARGLISPLETCIWL